MLVGQESAVLDLSAAVKAQMLYHFVEVVCHRNNGKRLLLEAGILWKS